MENQVNYGVTTDMISLISQRACKGGIMTHKEVISVTFFTIFTLVLFFFLQRQVLFSPDVSYLLHATNQILQGGHYAIDIFETNPPMILYLYSPVIFLAKIMSVHLTVAVQIYMFFLMSVSAIICLALLKAIINDAKDYYLSLFICGILFVLSIFSVVMFAQREHLLLIFMLPYLLCAALRLDHKSVNPWLAVVVGLFAGFGFAIKPYFLCVLCLVELLFIIERRKLFAWVRIESLLIASVLISYIVSIFIFQPGYMTTVLPLVSKYYFFVIKQSWMHILSMPYVDFSLIVAILYPFYREYDRYNRLGTVIYVALLGMIIAFVIPQNAWYYHVYPAFSLAFLLMLHCFAEQLHIFINNPRKKAYIAVMMLMFLYIPLSAEWKFFNIYADFKKSNSANELFLLFNNLPGDHTMNCFTASGTASCFPMVYEIKRGHYQSRFPFYWWYQGLVLSEKKTKNNDELNTIEKDKKSLIDATADDLNHYKTKWVIVDAKSFERRETPGFDVITSFLMNDRFHAAWRNYALYTRLGHYDVYMRKYDEY